jgi:hypothetical protein
MLLSIFPLYLLPVKSCLDALFYSRNGTVHNLLFARRSLDFQCDDSEFKSRKGPIAQGFLHR